MLDRQAETKRIQELENSMVKELTKLGVKYPEARKTSREQINNMGSTKTIRGECPIGGLSPVSCMFCEFGHMTDCHYPLDCEEANCSHYQQELEEV